jgi:excisionase family DNA binding protein
MAMRRGKGEEESQERWLEVDASMTGTLTFKDPVNLSINGRFEGTLDTKGNLSIGAQAQVKATIRGEKIIVGGNVQGSIMATQIIELRSTGRVNGKITSPRLVMQDGAIVHGTVEMLGGNVASQWMTVDDLARYLEVDASTVTQWAQEGRLPGQREDGTWRFERVKVEEWLAQEKIK